MTAVEWLESELDFLYQYMSERDRSKLFEQAKAMEKGQIVHAWENGALPDLLKEYKNSRTYYNETYGELEVYGKDSN